MIRCDQDIVDVEHDADIDNFEHDIDIDKNLTGRDSEYC